MKQLVLLTTWIVPLIAQRLKNTTPGIVSHLITNGLGAYLFNNWGKPAQAPVSGAFFFQIVHIVHFAVRKRFFASYTLRFGWLVYALSIPAVVISIILLLGGKTWSFWLGGFLFLMYAAYGYWVDYVKKIQWRKPLRLSIMFPYVFLYLGTTMFYWWPLFRLSLPLWVGFTVLYIIGTILNVTSH